MITVTKTGLEQLDLSLFGEIRVCLPNETYFKFQWDDQYFYVPLKAGVAKCSGCELFSDQDGCNIMSCIVKGDSDCKYKRVKF